MHQQQRHRHPFQRGGSTAVVANPESAPQITADLAAITKKNVAKIAPTRLADGPGAADQPLVLRPGLR